jgi:L-2-hydroxycarboxylate dehydrogenase (NAD+)
MSDVRVPVEALRSFVERAGRLAGVPDAHISLLVDSFVEADLRGVGTHGVARIPAYIRAFQQGIINPAPNMEVVHRTPAAMLVDADNGLGMVTGQLAMDMAIDLAATAGIGVVSVRNSNHSGMLAVHVVRAAEAGMIGYFTSNGAAIMTPWGGMEPRLSNGPFAWALPRTGGPHVIADMAASAAARGKIRQIARTGGQIPAGWALDSEGRPTTDALAAMEGVVLPMSAHKGYAIGFVNDALSAVLSGSALSTETPRGFLAEGSTVLDSWRIGHLAIALDPRLFVGADEFSAGMERLVESVRSAQLAADGSEILLPGEPEWRRREESLRAGVQLPESTVGALDAFAVEIGIAGLEG